MADLSQLTETGQKQYSNLISQIKRHKQTIANCEKFAKESPSDAVRRAKDGVIYHQKQLESHDSIISARIEKIVEEGKNDKQTKLQYLKDAEEKLERLESLKSRQQIASESELEKLEDSLRKLVATVEGNREPSFYATPSRGLRKMEESIPQPSETCGMSFQEMTREEQELSELRRNFPSSQTSYAIQHSPGTVYGPVSQLMKPKKSVKMPESRSKNNTTFYTDGAIILPQEQGDDA